MSEKLPPDFNAERYLASYPDVALSGIAPKDHYLRFGKLLGRSPSGTRTTLKRVDEKTYSAKSGEPSPFPGKAAVAPQASSLQTRPDPIVERPAGLDLTRAVPAPAAPKASADQDGSVTLEILSRGPFESVGESVRICAPLIAYAQLFRLYAPFDRAIADFNSLCARKAFREGETRIENAWFPEPSKLRLMFRGGAETETLSHGWSVRAYQADPATPERLIPAGGGIQLPALGPVFHDIELTHPLMPLFLELTNQDITQEIALLPFPSLLPGGIHAAELKALQIDPNPMDSFWSLSEALLQEFLGRSDWPERSITDVATCEGTGAIETSLPGHIREWIGAVFGLSIDVAGAVKPRSGKAGGRQNKLGLELLLPGDSIPTISALVSRRLNLEGASQATGPFLVAEKPTARPRWSVSVPADWEASTSVPLLRTCAPAASVKSGRKAVPVHLAIALRSRPSASFAMAEASSLDKTPVGSMPLSAVIESTDPTRTEALLSALRRSLGNRDLELLVRVCGPDERLRELLDQTCGSGKWTPVAAGAGLSDLAATSSNEILLTVSDRITLHDERTVPTLCALLQDDEGAASVGCALLTETIVKKNAVLKPATGGVFPAGVSFASSPRLAFFEPDVSECLPDMAYPVIANTLLLAAWRTHALADLPRPKGPLPDTAVDIHIGMALMDAGYRNLCTTHVQANIMGPYDRRDAIDPIGSAYLQPDRWESILNRVTIVRELF
jgi:hypothetical protein